jgi:hypothetical protein
VRVYTFMTNELYSIRQHAAVECGVLRPILAPP